MIKTVIEAFSAGLMVLAATVFLKTGGKTPEQEIVFTLAFAFFFLAETLRSVERQGKKKKEWEELLEEAEIKT